MKRIIPLAILVPFTLATACANMSQVRPQAHPGRAAYFVEDAEAKLVIEGTDQTIGESGRRLGHLYDGLDKHLGCVPQAKHYAERGIENTSKANTRVFTGLGIMLGGTAGGIGMLAYGGSKENNGLMIGGALLAMGSLIGSMVPIILSGEYGQKAMANNMDAINVYNDLHFTTPGCPGYRTPASALPTLPPPSAPATAGVAPAPTP